MPTLAAWFVAGGLAWTLSEYLIHRFVGHGPRREPVRGWRALTLSGLAAQFNEEHLAHHANPFYFASWWRKLAAALVAIPVLGLTLAAIAGLQRGLAFAVGFSAVYSFYEVVHQRIHRAAPVGPYGRWLRKNHLAHHFKSPRQNHGVTVPVFDLLFGTSASPPPSLVVPRKGAPKWLVDEHGQVREAHRAQYQVPS